MESSKVSVEMKYCNHCQKYCIIYDNKYEISIEAENFLHDHCQTRWEMQAIYFDKS